MLTLTPGSACDVCAEEYGSHRLPHSIPCGHVLCASCCTTIVEKTSARLAPVCPFCRVQFNSDSVRLIRLDFNSSGWSTPRRFPHIEPTGHDFTSELLARKTERLLLSEGGSRTRLEARRLEDKVAKVAAKKCSVEEVSALHKELQDWLMSGAEDTQTSSLYLSAALLRAILMNHLAHSEASKNSKTIEANLKSKVDDLEITNGKLEAELRRQRQQYTIKSEECQSLRTEASRLKALASTLGMPGSDSRPLSPTSPTPPSTSPVPPYPPTTPLSRFSSMHVRSASMSSSSRPSTPSATPISPTRSHTPSAPARSHTPALSSSTRSHTPALPTRSHTPSLRSANPPPVRSYTPAPPVPRYATPAPSMLRSHTPAPMVPPKSRRLSQPSPPKMMRSTSEEKAEAHERWLPPPEEYDKKYSRPPSRAAQYGHY
ncbi:hypothetical protein BDQ12DRAFT_610097 [Crucibulum laeve]|uniref:RING-type domain-containing protein n=1 Tax=Crucibulum laeve TaxID=68775 RepID=A0A5C3LV57_9AGAR|nr:hypothetical protein BDQ12DRAFT_610097 [Crucibulum laeve]